ncbi:MAG: NADH-quinone oxidoreductase subunit J [Phycisphaerales bacterium]|nr:NADH-quinone oxidoreductase subunit J [Phycisphaerales bacterium]
MALALPRPRVSAFVVGAIVAAAALGAVLLGLGLKNPGAIPNYHFYIFSVIALGAALRVISHPRPVYAALYFVLTILASCGLYLLLSAEFLAFALVIVYAGAILITYLFVIMLATEGPTADAVEAMNEYDRVSREPVLATIAGFIILGALTTAMATGVTGGAGKGEAKLTANTALMTADKPLALMPKKIEKVLREAKDADGKALLAKDESLAIASDQVRDKLVSENRIRAEQWVGMMPRTAKGEPAYAVRTSAAMGAGEAGGGWVVVKNAKGDLRVIPETSWPKGLELTGTEGVAFNLIDGHPGAIEIAGVILLMAMLGAVVLARKKVEMDESAKAEAAARLKQHTDLGVHLGEEAEFVPPSVGGEPVGAADQPAGGTR